MIAFPENTIGLLSMMQTDCVLCEVGSELLNMLYMT
jgi:hypothetical protein